MNSVSSQGGENDELSREGSPVAVEYRRGRTRALRTAQASPPTPPLTADEE